jgi:hypothetical protein
MKKIFILIAIIVFAVFGLSGDAFALVATENYSRSPAGSSIPSPLTISGTITAFSSGSIVSWRMSVMSNTEPEQLFSCHLRTITDMADELVLPLGNYINIGIVEYESEGCMGRYDTTFLESEPFTIIETLSPVIHEADSEILGWGASLSASAKDNVFAVISENKTTIALIMIAIITIMLIFGLIRDAVKNAKYGKDGWGDGSDV